ncbi:MAG: ATP-binding cassette domain-containing protein [Gemmatimonadetes bacterium]|nr:ATP-binding cassette domain-containing protein [Gemmatimonadota bacterium]
MANREVEMLRSLAAGSAAAFGLRGVRQEKDGAAVLDGVSLEIPPGCITVLVGPSGAGKTSLLRLLNRLDDPVAGDIFYHGRRVDSYPVRELRCRVAFVFQVPLLFAGTVRDNLWVAAELAGLEGREFEERAREALALAELDASVADRPGDRLSVGEKQRVTIARALVSAPEALLMDEPTAALDPETAERLLDTIRHLVEKRGLTIVMVTHRLAEARRAGDFAVLLDRGRVVEAGSVPEMFRRPLEVRTRAFLERGL